MSENDRRPAKAAEMISIYLKDWRYLNHHLGELREDQVLELLNIERAGRRRANILERLHARYCRLRTDRERMEIMKDSLL